MSDLGEPSDLAEAVLPSMAPPVAHLVDAHHPSRHALIRTAGRFVAVLVPTVVAFSATGVPWSAGDVFAIVVVSAIWFIALIWSIDAHAKELLALGATPAIVRGVVFGLLGASAADYWVTRIDLSRLTLLLLALGVLALTTLWEAFAARHLETRRRVLIVGTGQRSDELVRELAAAPALPFDLLGLVDDGSADDETPPAAPVLGVVPDLPTIVARHRPDLVVVAVGRDRPTTFRHILDSASTEFRVLELPQFYEHALGRVPVRDLPRAWFMSILHLYQRPHLRGAKRAFDIVVASLGLLVMPPSLLLTALLVRRTPGPIIIKQTRLGEHGRPFTIYKFRTMHEDAEAMGAVWASETDPRVTRVGRLLRRVRLDELPQLWNVLRGEMSIVGPRPERPEFLAQLEQEVPYWTRRHLVKPGLTGWAQLRRGYTADVVGSTEKLSFDLWYLRHRSVLVDLAICIQTIKMLFFGRIEISHPQPVQQSLATPPPSTVDLAN